MHSKERGHAEGKQRLVYNMVLYAVPTNDLFYDVTASSALYASVIRCT